MARVKELLAANLKFCRVRLGLSPERLAEISGLSPARVKELEEGKSFAAAGEFECLSRALGRKPYEMLFEGDEWETGGSPGLTELHMELKEKINELLDKTIRGRLGI